MTEYVTAAIFVTSRNQSFHHRGHEGTQRDKLGVDSVIPCILLKAKEKTVSESVADAVFVSQSENQPLVVSEIKTNPNTKSNGKTIPATEFALINADGHTPILSTASSCEGCANGQTTALASAIQVFADAGQTSPEAAGPSTALRISPADSRSA